LLVEGAKGAVKSGMGNYLDFRSDSRLVQLEDELDDEDTDLENDDIDQSEIELCPGIHHVRTADDIDGLVSDSPF
jgi:hypothetical protein